MEGNRSPWIVVVVAVAIVFLLLLFGGSGMMGFGVWGPGAMGGYGAGPWWGILMSPSGFSSSPALCCSSFGL